MRIKSIMVFMLAVTFAHHAAAKFVRVAELENDPKDKEEDKHELNHAAQRVIAPLAEGLGLLLQRQGEKCNEQPH